MNQYNKVKINVIFLIAISLFISACSEEHAQSKVQRFMMSINKTATEVVPDLPNMVSYVPYTYSAANMRDPFQAPENFNAERKSPTATQPDFSRKKQYLEYVDLEQLKMVGTIKGATSNNLWALIHEENGAVHRIGLGQYMGKNYGKVVAINPGRIDIVEIVPDGDNAWVERPRQLTLTN